MLYTRGAPCNAIEKRNGLNCSMYVTKNIDNRSWPVLDCDSIDVFLVVAGLLRFIERNTGEITARTF